MRWKNVVIPLLAVLLVGLLVVQPASAAETDDGGLIGAVSDYLFGWLSDNSVSEAPVPTDPPYVPGLIDQNLTLQGEVLDIYTGTPIPGATITVSQPGVNTTVTIESNATGAYTLTEGAPSVAADLPITISATAPGFRAASLYFAATPRYPEWDVPILMMPTEAPTPPEPLMEGRTMLYGYVATKDAQCPISGALVTLGNSSATTSPTGFYLFNNIDPGQHTLSVSAADHDPITKTVIVDATPTLHNLILQGHYGVMVTVLSTNAPSALVNDTVVSISGGPERTGQNPTTLPVNYGFQILMVAAEGYYPVDQYLYVEGVGETPVTVFMAVKEPVYRIDAVLDEDNARVTLNLAYRDQEGSTTALSFWVRDANGELVNTPSSPSDLVDGINPSYVAEIRPGTYTWGFDATHTLLGHLSSRRAITFHAPTNQPLLAGAPAQGPPPSGGDEL